MLVIFNKVKIPENWNSRYTDYLHALLSACFIFCVLYFLCRIKSVCLIMRMSFAPMWCPPPCFWFRSYTVFLYGFAPVPVFAFFVRVCSCALIGYPYIFPICKILMFFSLYCPRMIKSIANVFIPRYFAKFLLFLGICCFIIPCCFASDFFLYFFIFCDFFYSWWVWKVLYYM